MTSAFRSQLALSWPPSISPSATNTRSRSRRVPGGDGEERDDNALSERAGRERGAVRIPATGYRDREGDRHGRHDCYKTHRLTVTEIRVGHRRARCRRVETARAASRRRRRRRRRPVLADTYVRPRVRAYVSSATRFDLSRGPKVTGGGTNTRVLHTYDFRGDVAAWRKKKCSAGSSSGQFLCEKRIPLFVIDPSLTKSLIRLTTEKWFTG